MDSADRICVKEQMDVGQENVRKALQRDEQKGEDAGKAKKSDRNRQSKLGEERQKGGRKKKKGFRGREKKIVAKCLRTRNRKKGNKVERTK